MARHQKETFGSVLLTAPAGTAIPRLDQLVYQKARWIVERLRAKREVIETKSPARIR
jgi:hypothetical protein